MSETELLPFYQQFYSENLFIIPEKGTAVKAQEPTPVAPKSIPVPVMPDEEPVNGDTTSAKKFILAGENRQGLALIFSVLPAEFEALPRNNFLTKILAAIGRTPADVVYVNLQPASKLNLFDLSKATQVKQVVAFGNGLLDLASGFKINPYKPAGIGDTPLLIIDPLENIENDVNRKKMLWSGLQAIFVK